MNKKQSSILQYNDDMMNRMHRTTTDTWRKVNRMNENPFSAPDSVIAQLSRANKLDRNIFSAPDSAITRLSRVNKLDRNIFSTPDSVIAQLSRANKLDRNIFSAPDSAITRLSQVYKIDRNIFSTVESAITQLFQVYKIDSAAFSAAESTRVQLIKAFKLYQIPDIHGHIERSISRLASLDSSVLEAAKQFDLSDIEFCDDGTITYAGESYNSEEITTALDEQLETVKTLTLRERAEDFFKKYWMVLLIIQLIWNAPTIESTIEWYNKKYIQIQEALEEKQKICFTKKERSNLREGASMEATRIRYLPYDTRLEILDDIPRWYQVKYIDENGIAFIGWIAKINVDLEE